VEFTQENTNNSSPISILPPSSPLSNKFNVICGKGDNAYVEVLNVTWQADDVNSWLYNCLVINIDERLKENLVCFI
jgi:hypothetical protein